MRLRVSWIQGLTIAFILSSLITPQFSDGAEDWVIKIVRTSYNSKSVTGELYVNGKFIAQTLELPWNNNKSYISAIPDGVYTAYLRYDKKDQWRIQLKDVPGGRTAVQIHMGNYPSQIEGCVLVGQRVRNQQNAIDESGEAYKALKNSFYGAAEPVASPDVRISVQIQYQTGRTEFKDGDQILKYQDQGRWNFNGESYIEHYRDLKFIYMGFSDKYASHRVPLFGGILESKNLQNSPWRPLAIKLKRIN